MASTIRRSCNVCSSREDDVAPQNNRMRSSSQKLSTSMMRQNHTSSLKDTPPRDPATASRVRDCRQTSANGNARDKRRGEVEQTSGRVQPGTAADARAAATERNTSRGQRTGSGVDIVNENGRRGLRWRGGKGSFGVTTAVLAAAVLFATSAFELALAVEHEHEPTGRNVRLGGGSFGDAVDGYHRHRDGGQRGSLRRRWDASGARRLSPGDASGASGRALGSGDEDSESSRTARAQVGTQQSREGKDARVIRTG